MRDNRDPQLIGEQLLEFRKIHRDKKLSQVQDLARETGVAIGISAQQLRDFYSGNGHK